ncbi:MAG: hypothetical protein AABZ57_06435 [Candidatus Margulisiibacteriota bacterium]
MDISSSFHPFKTVYSYTFSEIREVRSRIYGSRAVDLGLMRAIYPEGGLDRFHEPIIDQLIEYNRSSLPALSGFTYRYPTAGSEEGIREVMTRLSTEGVGQIHVLQGEYEGYKAVAETRGIKTTELPQDFDPKDIASGSYWFISNPSARDGRIIPDEYINAICEAGHYIFYDLAYLNSTAPHTYDLSHPNIIASVISFSKPYGLFYDRIGFAFSRTPAPALYGNKWFKNIPSLLLAQELMKTIEPGFLYKKYRPVQEQIVGEINMLYDLGMQVSDPLLLAFIKNAQSLNGKQKNMIAPFKRGDGYRFCLTPYYFERDPQYEEIKTALAAIAGYVRSEKGVKNAD